jgi:hypothetical protein
MLIFLCFPILNTTGQGWRIFLTWEPISKPQYSAMSQAKWQQPKYFCKQNITLMSYGYNRQHNNKAEYLPVKTKTDVGMCLTYLV